MEGKGGDGKGSKGKESEGKREISCLVFSRVLRVLCNRVTADAIFMCVAEGKEGEGRGEGREEG